MSSLDAILIGRSILHYRIVQKLGEGGMGAVFKAIDLKVERPVALKFTFPSLLQSPASRERFLNEARAISRLNHPNIETLYDVEQFGNEPFLVLEYLPGGTLKELIDRRKSNPEVITLERAVAIALGIAEGLAQAHRNGIVHRDIKPANILFSGEGLPKISDFGLSKFRGTPDLTKTGNVLGTAGYMAPEQAQGQEADQRSDLFSFGTVLFEMLTGQKPLQADSVPALLYKIVHEPAPEPRALRPDIPESLNLLVKKCLEKNPDDRPQRAVEVVDTLRSLHRAFESKLSSADATWPMPASKPAASRRVVSRRAWLWLLLAAVLGSVLFWRPAILLHPIDWLRARGVPKEKKLAVLAFTNVGNNPATQAFCDGLVETLTSMLTQLEDLHGSLWVVPASEVRTLKSPNEARRLYGANLAITGSVQRTENNVRLTINLVDAALGRNLASRVIDTPADNLASLENSVLGQVADLLAIELKSKAPALPSSSVAGAYDYYLQGRGYLYRFDRPGNCDRAIAAFQRALTKDSRFAFAYTGLGEAYLAKYNLTADRQWLEPAMVNSRQAVALNDHLAAPKVTIGAIYRILGQYDQAVQELKAAMSLDPLNPDAYRELATTYDNSNHLQEAEKTYRQAIDLQPGSWLACKDLGVFYVTHNRYAEAEPLYRKVIELTPDNDWGYRNLGTLYELKGRYADAEPMLKKAIALQPTFAAYTNLATVYYFEGHYSDAVKMNELAVNLPEGKNNSVVWGNLGDAYRWTPGLEGKAPQAYRRAIQLAESDLALNPKSFAAAIGLAVNWAKLSDHHKALEYLADARRLNPSQMHVEFQSVIVYELAGRRKLALQALEEALRAGYSKDEVRREPELAKLRQDPHFQRLMK